MIHAIECALDELAAELGIDPFELRRRNVVVPGDDLVDAEVQRDDLTFGSYGLDQCLDLVEDAMRRGNGASAPDGWRTGEGMAASMIATVPPRGHFATASCTLTVDGRFEVRAGTAEFGNGTSTVHTQIAASALGTTADRITLFQSDTDITEHDTGAYGSAGSVVAGTAVRDAARRLADTLIATARAVSGGTGDAWLTNDGVAIDDALVPYGDLVRGGPITADGNNGGSPRSLVFNVQGFRVAVNETTGQVKILQSVQAGDAGTILNPNQCRGQVEGGVAQAIGSALFEEMLLENGRVTNPTLRGYHIPQLSDVPETEVYFADTYDEVGPHGAKSMSESPYNPVAPALSNAIADAVGVRLRTLPMTPARIWAAMRDTQDG
ncbi:putative carbon monoxide dehydrogenase large subunit [Rhodococcus rhodnii LMG 5362]|uniref:Putative carbon monoxide dehydrogenase large subunit n=1 Tax=Rhodococcus rhodnii LMG 5362 TaxID=1273125 RepID=R7WIY1_9NOCA|nr:putative carbon monoxide dehydrogenase large subunit [Rhodococcus rhodnii LMG 5362]